MFTTVKGGFSQHRRVPRVGKIRLGIKKKTTEGKEYPSETEHFVVPQEVALIYGDTPTELDVMLPVEDTGICFPQKLAMYGKVRGLVCEGNGEQARRLNEKTNEREPRACPCEHLRSDANPRGDCSPVAHLMVLLPKVGLGGIYQISTRSYNSVVDINSGIDYVRGLVGRAALVPLKLRRVKRETHHNGKKSIHYTMTLTLDANVEGINRLREDSQRILSEARLEIEGPAELDPRIDPVDIDEGEEIQAITELVMPEKSTTPTGETKPLPREINPVSPPTQGASQTPPKPPQGRKAGRQSAQAGRQKPAQPEAEFNPAMPVAEDNEPGQQGTLQI